MGSWWEGQTLRKVNFIKTLQVGGICKTLGKRFLVWKVLMDMLGGELMVLRVCTVNMELTKDIVERKNYMSLAIKRSYVL